MATIDDNLSGLRNRVRRWLHETASGNSFWSNTFLDQQLNVSYRRRCADLVSAYEGYFTNVATRDLTADQSRYAWPPGFERLLRMELVRSDGTLSPLERWERHYAANPANTSYGQDTYFPTYRPIGGGFVLEPTPSTTVSEGIRIEYHGLPTQMQADGDSMHADFPRSYDELIVLDAVVASLDSENLLETGGARTALRQRAEWEQGWERYIDSRMISSNEVVPFISHYEDY